MRFHRAVLTEAQQSILRAIGPWTTRRGFYLAGGTAIALYLGHRESVDLDWFGEDPIAKPRELIKEFESAAGLPFDPEQATRGTVLGVVQGVKVSFFRYRYPMLGAFSSWSGCLLSSADDLAAMKLSAIYDRGAKRDFVDLHALMKHHSPLHEMVAMFARKYPRANLRHLVKALLHFDTANTQEMPVMLDRTTWKRVRKDIEAEVLNLEIIEEYEER